TGVGDAAVGEATEAEETAAATADAERVTLEGVSKAAIVIAVFVVPMVIGSFLAKQMRMPDYGWKFSLAIGTLLAAAVVVALGEIKLGPDLSGGITLIYEIENPELATVPAPDDEEGTEDDKAD